MAKHKQRISRIGRYALPPEGTFTRRHFDKWLSDHPPGHAVNKEVRRRFKKAVAIVTAQLENGAGFPIDDILRYFLQEYNGRNFSHGLRSLPASFNILEAFYEYKPEYMFFKLREERDHLFSFLEFLDYVTSGDFTDDARDVVECIEEGIIYSYNILNNPGDITFSIDNGTEFGVGGASFVRYGSEINVAMLAGEKTDVILESKKIQEGLSLAKPYPGRESLRPAEDRKREAVPLMKNNDFWQTVFLSRFDLEDMTQNARYVLKDIGNGFMVLTDDINVFLDEVTGDFIRPEDIDSAKKLAEDIEQYETIFEICKTVLHLPLYFEHYGDLIVDERHPTKLSENIKRGKWISKKKLIGPKERIVHRRVSVLSNISRQHPTQTFYKAPPFKIDISGYWKRLPADQIGGDKRDGPIHGRTWVEKVLSWIQVNEDPGALKATSNPPSGYVTEKGVVAPNKGYIYVMRSAGHDKDIFKVGMTRRSTDIRSDELSRTTGAPDKFLVVQEWEVSDCIKAELLIHKKLAPFRLTPNREFFKAPYKEIFKAIDSALTELEKERSDN